MTYPCIVERNETEKVSNELDVALHVPGKLNVRTRQVLQGISHFFVRILRTDASPRCQYSNNTT